MTLIEKIPLMTDADVLSLLANAKRLAEEGSDRQKASAEELIPALEEAAAERHAAKQAVMAERRASLKKAKTAKADAPAEEVEAA